ncbi:MAG: heme o synthase [Opitutales bacterium]
MNSTLHNSTKTSVSPANLLSETVTGRAKAGEIRATVKNYLELTKPRLSLLSIITALVGYVAARPSFDTGLFVAMAIGTSLAAGGAATLNQWFEQRADALMSRTRNRPIPAGAVAPSAALLLGVGLGATGTVLLLFGVNPLAGILGALTILTYVLVYTPLKKQSHWCTEVGAIAGAFPPLIGWAAAEGNISGLGWILFAILLFWQMPHFHAIAWIYRDDYAAAGFPMLAVTDHEGSRVGRHATGYSVLLLLASISPVVLGYNNFFYLAAAILLGAYLLKQAIAFQRADRRKRENAARKLFLVSIAYLPALLGALVVDRWMF